MAHLVSFSAAVKNDVYCISSGPDVDPDRVVIGVARTTVSPKPYGLADLYVGKAIKAQTFTPGPRSLY